MTIKYEIIYSQLKEQTPRKGFEELVNDKLNQGYTLHGSPGVYYHPKVGQPFFYQAVIKEEEKK